MKNSEIKMEVQSYALAGIEFKLGDNKKFMTPEKIQQLMQHLREWAEYYEFWEPLKRYYEDYNEEQMIADLNVQEERRDPDDTIPFSIGENFSAFIKELNPNTELPHGNNTAADIIAREFRLSSKENAELRKEIVFDPEYSHCYVYAKTREAALAFMKWANEKYYQPVIKKFKEIANGIH